MSIIEGSCNTLECCIVMINRKTCFVEKINIESRFPAHDLKFSVGMKTETLKIFYSTLGDSMGKEVARSTFPFLAPGFFLHCMSNSILSIYGQKTFFIFSCYKFSTTFKTLKGSFINF